MPLQAYKAQPPFNGVIDVEGTPVEVVNGQGSYEGKQYFVSKDGKYVMDMNMQVIAKILDKKLTPLSKSDVPEMIELGIIRDPKAQSKARMTMPMPQDGSGMMGGLK